jgi:hypothetical protein
LRSGPAAEFAGIAAGLCQAVDLRFELGPGGSSWDPATRTVRVWGGAAHNLGREAAWGIVAHEVGHALYSRYPTWLSPGDGLRAALLNVLEDGRVEEAMMRRFPGVRAWIAALRAARGGGVTPPTGLDALDLLGACLAEGRGVAVSAPGSAAVRAALSATREARRRYLEDFAPDPAHRAPPDLSARREALGLPPSPATPWEACVELLAYGAFRVCVEEIEGAVMRVVRADLLALASEMARRPETRRAVAVAREAGDDAAIVRAFLAAPRRPTLTRAGVPGVVWGEAERALLALLRQRDPARGGVPFEPGAAPSTPSPVRDVEGWEAALEAALPPRGAGRWRGHGAQGARVALSRAMAWEADGRSDQVFARRAPGRPRAAALLLIDLSGSMRGARVDMAISAGRGFLRGMASRGVPCAVVGFQDHLFWVHPFDAAVDEAALARMDAARGEPCGVQAFPEVGSAARSAAFSDHGACLREAGALLMGRPERDRVLVCVSDGRVHGRRSGAADLREAIEALRGHVALVGIGVGPGTAPMAACFPRGCGELELADVPATVGRLLAEALG